MHRRTWFVGERVTAADAVDTWDQIEAGELDTRKEIFAPPQGTGWLLAAATVAEHAPASQVVVVGPFTAFDKLGQRVRNAASSTDVNLAAYSDPVNPRIIRLYAKFARAESDPRTDILGNTINFKKDESFAFQIDAGAPAGVPVAPALRTDESVLIAKITVPAAGANVLNANIVTSEQNLNSALKLRHLQSVTQGLQDAILAAIPEAPSTANRMAVISDILANLIGSPGQTKIVTLAALEIDVERAAIVDSTGAKFIRLNNVNLLLTAGAGAAGDKDYAGAIANAWHYVYAIGDVAAVLPDETLASLSSGPGFGNPAPTLPAGYDVFRLIGCFLVQAGAILPFRQINGEVIFDDVSLSTAFGLGADPLVGGPPTGYAALSLAPYVPPIAERAIIGVRISRGGAANVGYQFQSLGGPAIAGRTLDMYDGSSGAPGEGSDWEMRLHVSVTQTINWRRVLGAVCDVEVVVRGFVPDFNFD